MTRVCVALLACTNVVGGHEYQLAALGQSLAKHVDVTVFVNRAEQAELFRDAGLEVRVMKGLLLGPGPLPWQYVAGWHRRTEIRAMVAGFDHVIVSAGAVEAGVAVGVALRGLQPASLYLPSFYNRVPVWGWKGHIYNCVLGTTCKLFDRIITINRIQARVIRAFSGCQTLVVANLIRQVQLPVERGPSRMIFIGRMDRQKRVDELMRWLDIESNPIRDLLLIGDGPLRPELERLAQKLTHLNCTFLGWTKPEDQDRLIRASDVLVLNSLIEGEPLVVREARVRGMSIVARTIVGTRGVTSRAERFSTQQGLIDRLADIALRANFCGSLPLDKNSSRIDIKREQHINALLKVIVRNYQAVV